MPGKWISRLALRAAARMSQGTMIRLGARHSLSSFRRAARTSVAYQTILVEAGLEPKSIRTISDFTSRVPVLDKAKTFARFPLQQLCVTPVGSRSIQNIITSSGQGGRFAFGMLSRSQMVRTVKMIDLALDANFQVFTRPTLLVNCLPMGVGFQSESVTIAETSVREDMVIALIKGFGDYYDQIVVVCDPLFLKRVLDYATEQRFDWMSKRCHFVIGEESFSESYRDYVGVMTGIDPENEAHGFIGSTYGVGELAMNLLFETRRSVAIRRLVQREPEVRSLLYGGEGERCGNPMVFAYNPLRTMVEVLLTEEAGLFGRLVITLTDPGHAVPLPRYSTGDRACFIGQDMVAELQVKYRLPKDVIDFPLVAVSGRDKDALPGGFHVAQFKEAIFSDVELARCLSGAFTVSQNDGSLTLHLQLGAGCEALGREQVARLCAMMPAGFPEDSLRIWPFEQFPFAMTLDYERKLNYFVSGAGAS